MSDETQPVHRRPLQIDGPVVHSPVTPQVRSENLKVLAPQALQWRPDDPVTIIEDMKERVQPGDGKAHSR